MPVLFLNTTLQNSTGKQGLLYCTNDVNNQIAGASGYSTEGEEYRAVQYSTVHDRA